jgi:hypothetical protein
MPPTLPTPLGKLVVRAFELPAPAADDVGFAFDLPAIPGEFSLRPLAFDGTFTAWWARRDGTGDVVMTVEYAAPGGAAFATVGGTDPFITADEWNEETGGLDWTTLDFVQGGTLRVTLVSFTGAMNVVGLTIGATRTP